MMVRQRSLSGRWAEQGGVVDRKEMGEKTGCGE